LTVGVKSVDQALSTFTRNFAFPVVEQGGAGGRGHTAGLEIGAARIELAEGATAGDEIATFVGERGEGLYSLELEVDDLGSAERELTTAGVEMRSVVGRDGKRALRAGPHGTHGVVIVLRQA
jgi:hypothetical protein